MAADILLESISNSQSDRSKYIKAQSAETIDRYIRAIKAIEGLKETESLAKQYICFGPEEIKIEMQVTVHETGVSTSISITYRGAKLLLEDAEAIVAGRKALAETKESEDAESIA